jgi:hypothetical protein
MAFKLKGLGSKKVTDNTHNMTPGAAVKMTSSPVMQYTSPVKQTRGVAGKEPDYEYKDGEVTGIIERRANKQSGVYRPTKKGAEMMKKGECELFKPGAMDDYKGSIVEGEGGVIRGFKSDTGEFTRFTNPTTRDRLNKEQQKQLKDFERTIDIYNTRQTQKRETVRKVQGYEGPYRKEPVQKKYKK